MSSKGYSKLRASNSIQHKGYLQSAFPVVLGFALIYDYAGVEVDSDMNGSLVQLFPSLSPT
jgi:hypothetical protein